VTLPPSRRDHQVSFLAGTSRAAHPSSTCLGDRSPTGSVNIPVLISRCSEP
jgi:hypothetical protein